ncbi:MFS general substrate transporter [Basidiobolus meristosporus CBS 931.73]|uniref:MFS general substrate transporter n=1 Tax=Basidiobolus meristosporus CBS 931.73 TaxID=1314790 RepID=A0A1Y1YJG6_9FUNG|nr:MFS general substrate transporter [Basidiobolus meristosporus CBS 931.73]|eukprot:ORX98003.1 MFS general substrate transporter [Basidiobolus meristosporus CBS 931.73]
MPEPPLDVGKTEGEKVAAFRESTEAANPPDGGFGWFVLLGSFLIHFSALGTQYTYGIYQEYYFTILFQGQVKASTLSLIGTLSTSIMSVLGIFTGKLTDRYGYRTIEFIGSVFVTGGLVAASFSREVWQLYLTQGVLCGVGTSFCFYPAVSIPAQWFSKRRGLATGIAVAGTGIGGLVLSPLTRKLIDSAGIRWTLRIMGIGAFVVLLVGCALLRTRVTPGARGELNKSTLFKDLNFQLMFASGTILGLGYMVPLFYIPSYAVDQGLSTSQGALLVGIVNATSAAGRIVLGSVADKVGRVNMLFVCIAISSLDILLFWNFARQFAAIAGFVILYGFFAGGYISLIPVVTADLFGVQGIATTTGLVYASSGIGYLIGIPVAGVILDSTGPRRAYTGVIIFAGATMFVGALLLLTMGMYRRRRALQG